jgi:hypothetical protein
MSKLVQAYNDTLKNLCTMRERVQDMVASGVYPGAAADRAVASPSRQLTE